MRYVCRAACCPHRPPQLLQSLLQEAVCIVTQPKPNHGGDTGQQWSTAMSHGEPWNKCSKGRQNSHRLHQCKQPPPPPTKSHRRGLSTQLIDAWTSLGDTHVCGPNPTRAVQTEASLQSTECYCLHSHQVSQKIYTYHPWTELTNDLRAPRNRASAHTKRKEQRRCAGS